MPNPDWYKKKLSELDSWHAAFSAQCAATGTTHGLSAGNVTQAATDATFVAALLNFDQQIRGFVQAWTEYRDAILRGDPAAALPGLPTLPAALTVPLGGLPGIEARTRSFANIIKADADYTPQVGEDYGIVAVAGGGPTTPGLVATALPGTSQVSLAIAKGGYSVVAIDMRRGGGGWVQIGVSQTATFVDATAPLVAGQPEVREYRAQGMVGNARVGNLSAVVSAVTVP